MRNYFETQRVNWNTWNPNQIVFKSNRLVKKLLPEDNILSWTSKGNRDQKMSELTGGKQVQGYNGHSHYGRENYKGVMVHLQNMKSDFPSANIDFIDYTKRVDSVGNSVGNLDVLVYLTSFHHDFTWVKCPKTKTYIRQSSPNHTPLEEGYRMCYGGQGDSNSMLFEEFHELVQITEAIKDFLVEFVVPANNGTLAQNHLLVA